MCESDFEMHALVVFSSTAVLAEISEAHLSLKPQYRVQFCIYFAPPGALLPSTNLGK